MKTLRIITFALLLRVFVSDAMDILSLSNMCSDICCFKRPRAIHKNNFNLQEFPLELHGKIIKKVFDLVNKSKAIDQKKLEEYVLKIPLYWGVKFVQEYDELQKICKQAIAGKKFLAHELFCTSIQERNIFIRMANRSFLKNNLEGNIAADDYNVLVARKNENIKKGLELTLIDGNKTINYMDFIGTIGMGGLYFCAVLFFVTPFFDTENKFRHINSYLFFNCFFGGLGMYWLAYILRTPEQRKNYGIKKIKL